MALLILGAALIIPSCASKQQLSKSQQIDQLLKGLEAYRVAFDKAWQEHLAPAKPKESGWRGTVITYLKQTFPRYSDDLRQEWKSIREEQYLVGLYLDLEQAFTLLSDEVWEAILEKYQPQYAALHKEACDKYAVMVNRYEENSLSDDLVYEALQAFVQKDSERLSLMLQMLEEALQREQWNG